MATSCDIWAHGCLLYDLFARNGSSCLVSVYDGLARRSIREALRELMSRCGERLRHRTAHDCKGNALIHKCLQLPSVRPSALEIIGELQLMLAVRGP